MNVCIAKLSFRVVSWSALFLLLLAEANAQITRPSITAVRQERTNLLITASVPAGIRRVVLESRERFNSAAWEPRAVTRLEGQGGLVNFRLPCSRTFEALRVRAEATDPLPGSFYTGETNFLSEGTSPSVYTDFRAGTGTMGTPPETTREVVESDIWKLREQTLYFFNQYRGLQVIDLSTPGLPVLRGTLDLPASGEQMYLLGDNHLVLLAGDPCSSSGTESQVVVVEEANGTPSIVARLPVAGYVMESRIVGHSLYVASQTMRPMTGTSSTSWEWGTLVSSFDLENPKVPVARGTLWYSGYGNVVSANETFLFVAMQDTNWWQSLVRVVDITAPDGTMNDYVSMRTAGRVLDKFKLDYNNGVFTAISEDSRASGTNRLVTKLETYRLPDPRSMGPAGVTKLGELELGWGERLRATRFDENRVYVVTFFQIDPLWVVDLSKPASPSISGSVDVPGWSTYIQPLGSQLVTMGVESNHVAVSLFDVADPAAPALLSRVRLGDYYSWSEANYDEKAFGVFPEDGLILVPYYGSNTNGIYNGVQLIDLLPGELVARGTIEHTFQPRRAMLYRNNVLSVTGFELVSVDATDRDNPEVQSRIPLAWNVARVVVHGDYLLQVDEGATGWYMQGQSPPVIRVSSSSGPNEILSELPLSNLAILGVAHQGNQLYVAQGAQSYYYYPYYPPVVVMSGTGGDATVNPTPVPAFLLTVLDLSDLPNLRVAGQSTVPTDNYSMGNFKAVFPGPGLLVWVEQANFNIWLDYAFVGHQVEPFLLARVLQFNGAAHCLRCQRPRAS